MRAFRLGLWGRGQRWVSSPSRLPPLTSVYGLPPLTDILKMRNEPRSDTAPRETKKHSGVKRNRFLRGFKTIH